MGKINNYLQYIKKTFNWLNRLAKEENLSRLCVY